MKVPAIRKLIKEDIATLRKAEEDLMEERALDIDIDGADEGEKLTHIYGAIWIKEQVEKGDVNEREALRAFMEKVRESIS